MAPQDEKTQVRKRDEALPEKAKGTLIPPVDIYENTESVLLLADMPGVDKEALEVSIDKNQLTIFGTVKGRSREGYKERYSEMPEKNFYRAFTIGEEIHKKKIAATINHGVLKITLPKMEKMQPRKIEIKVK